MPAFVGLWCVAALLGISAAGVVLGRWSWSFVPVYFASLLVCLAGLAAAFWHLWMGLPPETLGLEIGLPGTGARFRLDPLAAFFLLVTNLGGALASLYALGYGRHEQSQARVLPFYPAYLAGMNLVVLADDAFSFLVAWEFMSLSSWALVLSNHRHPENVRAGYVYLLMATCGTLALLLAFGLLAGANGGYAFEAIRASRPDAFAAGLVFLLVLAGAGSKAGLVPLHIWLPLAHPAAPSHVSALMSGVMTKIAIYGFIRIVFDLLGTPVWWWSLIVLGLGGITAVLGVLYALMQQDLKRLLAYSTVENVGIIFIGLGLAMAFRANGMAACGGAGDDGRAAARVQPFAVQEPAVLRRGRGRERDRRAQHGEARRPDPSSAAHGCRVPDRLRGDFGAAAAERLRLGMADVPGNPDRHRAAAMGPAIHDPRGGRAARALGGACSRLLRQGLWHCVSRAAAQRCSPECRRGRRPFGRRHVRRSPSCALPRESCPGRSSIFSSRWCRVSPVRGCPSRP